MGLDAGFDWYELSNWALPGRECRHNLVYWHAEPYIGMGAGAHSFFAGQRFANVDAPNRSPDSVVGRECGNEFGVVGAFPPYLVIEMDHDHPRALAHPQHMKQRD